MNLRPRIRLWMLLGLVALVAVCLWVYRSGRERIEGMEMARWHEMQAGELKSNVALVDTLHRRAGGETTAQLKSIERANALRARVRDRLNEVGKPVPPVLEGSLDAIQAEVEANRGYWNIWYASIRPVCVSALNWHNRRASELRSRWAFLPAWEQYRDRREFDREMHAVREIDAANRIRTFAARTRGEQAEAGSAEQLGAILSEALRPDSSWPVRVVPDLHLVHELRLGVEIRDREREAYQDRIVTHFLRSLPDYYIPKKYISTAPPMPPPSPPRLSSAP